MNITIEANELIDSWTDKKNEMHRALSEFLDAKGLHYDLLDWTLNLHLTLAIRNVDIGKKFLDTVLNKAETELLEALRVLTSYELTTEVFATNKVFQLNGDFNQGDIEAATEFIEEYGSKDDLNHFAFLFLVEEELSDEQEEQVIEYAATLGRKKANELATVIEGNLLAIQQEVEALIRKKITNTTNTAVSQGAV